MNNLNAKHLQPGQIIEIRGFIQGSRYGGVTFFSGMLPDYILIGEHTITFTVPDDFNAVVEAVKAVDAHIESVKKDYHEKLGQLQEQRNQLLMLTFAGQDILDPVESKPK